MSRKDQEKKKKKRLRQRQTKVSKIVAGKVIQPVQSDLGLLNPAWREFYRRVIDKLEDN